MPFSTLIDLSARTELWARAEGRGWSHSEMLPVFGAVLTSHPLGDRYPLAPAVRAQPESWFVCLLSGQTAQAQLTLGTPPAISGKTQE